MSIFTNSFWLGDIGSFSNILSLEDMVLERQKKALDTGEKFDMYASYMDEDDEDEDEKEYQIINGVAIIQVSGDLITKDTWISRLFGMTSYEGINRQLNDAAQNEAVARIVMDFNTPGGNSQGVDETGNLIAKIDKEIKPVHGYTSGSANSAGYWLIAACRDITCTKLSSLGSIGVVTIHQEVSKMLEARGITVTVLRDGEMKAKPNRYEKLDEKTKAAVNGSLKILGNFFLDWVAEQRGFDRSDVRTAVGEGRVFFGSEAVQNGLADRLMTFDEFMGKLKVLDSIEPQAYPTQVSNALNVSNVLSSEQMKPVSEVVEKAISNSDRVLANLTNPKTGDTDMSVVNKGKDKSADVKLQTEKGELSLEQVEAAIEMGELVLTKELEASIVEAKAGDTSEEIPNTGSEPESSSEDDTTDLSTGNKSETNDKEGDTSIVAHIQTQLNEQISSNTKLTLELESVKAKLSTQDDTVTALTEITKNSCHKMTVGLGGAQMDLSSMDVATLLNHHSTLAAQYQKAFKSGGVAVVESATDDDKVGDSSFIAPTSMTAFSK